MRIEQITFTRFIAAIAIVFFHFAKDLAPFNNQSISFLINEANIGVSYFFILSGFVMILAYQKKERIDILVYLKKRFARIYPVYVLGLLLVIIYFLIINKTINLKSLFLNLTMTQAWRPGQATSLNYPGWSLSVELFFYILFPFLFNKLYSRLSFKLNLVLILIFFIISQVLIHILLYSSYYEGYPSNSHDFIFYFPLLHLNEFLVGNIAGLFFITQYKTKNYDWHITVMLIVLILALKFKSGLYYHNGLLAIVFVPLIVLIASNTGKITSFFKNKHLVFLGEVSYSIYILQVPVFYFSELVFDFLEIKNLTVRFFFFITALILISVLVYKFLENPLRKRIRALKINSSN